MKDILLKKRNVGRLIVTSFLCIFLITTSTIAMIETSFKTSSISNNEIETLSYTFSFTKPSLKEIELHDSIYTRINMLGSMAIGKKAGEPAMPVKFVKLLLEPKKTISDIKVFGVPLEIDTGNINLKDKPVVPYQYPVPIGTKTSDLFAFDKDIYASKDSYPSKIVEGQTIGYCRGYAILNIAIHPVQYNPGKGSLFYYPEITVTIELKEDGYENPFYRNDLDDEEWVKKLVYNPETTDCYQSELPALRYSGGICDPSDDYDYVIITTTQNDLDDWPTSGSTPYNWTSLMDKHGIDDGLICTLVTIQDIDACADYYNSDPLFNDTEAHMREFCKDAYQDWETDYIFIGGDAEWIPARLMDYDYESNVDADIYWNHLDNTFNEDHDNDWGEEGDTGFDLYAEMYIGRITCDTPQDVSNWMTKSFYYADSTFKDYLDNAAFYGGNTGWSCEGDDFIDYSAIKGTNDWLGPNPGEHGPYPTWLGFQFGFETWNVLTPSMAYNLSVKWTAEPPNSGWSGGSESAAINGLKTAINNDQVTLISGIAHANEHMSLDVYDSTWESGYHNTMPFFIHDYGCHCGDMDATDDGVLHSMLFHSDTELAFGCVYNTGYGWGSLEDTNSSSALQQKLFWDYMFDMANSSGSTINWQLGKAMAFSKDSMAPTIDWTYSGAPGSWRGIIQSCLLFADPAQRIKPPVQPEHNIGIQKFDVLSHEPADADIWVNVTLYNNGLNNETNVEVRFLVNDVEENSKTISFFEKSTNEEVGWLYHTPLFGWETLCINVTLVPGENISEDNVICQDVIYGPDIAVTQIQASDSLGQGFAKPVKGFIENLGPTDETVNIDLIANSMVVNTTSIYLASGGSTWVTFMWDATTSGLGTYDVIIHAVPVLDEYYLDNQNKSHTVTVFFALGNILLVDDDEGDSYETWYENAILASHFVYEIWDRNSQPSPSPSTMQGYDVVVWFTGDDYTTTLESIDQSNLSTFLDNGGSLFISGQDLGYDIRSTSFYSDYLHANYLVDTAGWDVDGETGDIIGDGLAFGINSGDGANNQNYPDGISPIAPATSCFFYSDALPNKAGVRVNTTYRVVYLGFGFEAIDNMIDRTTVMNRSLIWLANISSPSNQPPVFSDENPSDGSTKLPVTITSLTVTIEDPDGDNFDWSIETNPDVGDSSGTGDSNGIKTCAVSGLTYLTTYTWYVNATDVGSGIWTREIYTFTTKSSINDLPIANFSYSPLNPTIADTIDFIDSSTDSDGYLVNWTWNFGDGNITYEQNPTHQYASVGNYTVILTICDDEGATNSTAKQISVSFGICVDISLETGWNLITIPVENNWMASTLAENITGCLSVSKWDAINQTYHGYIVGGPPAFDFPIVDGYGYFVDVDQPSILSLTGPQVFDVSIPLKIGWNLIGWYHSYNTTASSLAENITGCLSVSKWDAINQTYHGYIVGGPPAFDFDIVQGMGLFVDVTTESTWYGDG